jgi:transcriptional regulator with XRE-family HTH domain
MKDEDEMTFAAKLQELREGLGLSRSELAERAAIPPRTLDEYERGTRQPLWTTFVTLARALEVPLATFEECVAAAERPGSRQNGFFSPRAFRPAAVAFPEHFARRGS